MSPSATQMMHTGSTTCRLFNSGSKGKVDMTSNVTMYTALAQNLIMIASRRMAGIRS
ncbi:MAG: hypothetical protein LAN18_00620 [Acidobacteriia bacterium]|nr:hypothetical protein [Terriglobia bacterium]